MKTVKRLVWSGLVAAGLLAASAAPSFAGLMFNHTESFIVR